MNKKKLTCLILFSFMIFPFIFQIVHIGLINDFTMDENKDLIQMSAEVPGTRQWIKNPNFTSQESWFLKKGGDTSDVNALISGEQANFDVIGEQWTFSNISGTPKSSDWTATRRPGDSIYPDLFNITKFGCNATHEYWEDASYNRFGVFGNQTRNRPSVLWKRIITMPTDMSDYSITAAEISAIFNGSANTNVETPNDTLSGTNPSAAEYDHVKFYIQLSDLASILRYEIAHYEPRNLGFGNLAGNLNQEWHGTEHYISDTSMTSVSQDVLKFYLTRVLESDYRNFTIFLGIDIDVEDNYGDLDRDTYYYLLIKSCNLTFDYEKKINQFTSVSWNQICDKISSLSEHPILVQDATLNFKYKIDELWNASLSPNSEIRILINDNKHTETVKLSTATTSFQQAKIGGFDITHLVSEDVNFTLQVYLADDFILDQNKTVSIDDVSLNISYIIIEPDEPIQRGPDISWLVYTLIGAIIGIVVIIGLYQAHFKYPPLVRKIRKLRKNIRKGKKKIKSIIISKREDIIESKLQDQINIIEIETQILEDKISEYKK